MRLEEVPTPALVVDVEAMERNIEKMAAFFRDGECKLRPHFKAHKSPAVARRQLDAGGCVGLTCATVGEAEVLARYGDEFSDVLIANQVIGPGKALRAAEVARVIDLTVAIDSAEGARQLSAAAETAGSTVGALVDINVGMPRCGIRPEEAAELAKEIHRLPGLEFRGVMGYEGHAVMIESYSARRNAAESSMSTLLEAKRLVEDAGLEVKVVSGGGTGTYDVSGRIEGVTEIQAGSYVFMDDAYLGIEGTGFERAMTLRATVISRPSARLAVADAGLKAIATDHGNPTLLDPSGDVLFLSDEHASLRVEEGVAPIGSPVSLSVGHIDPTVNLHDVLWAVAGGEVVETWRVEARGYQLSREDAIGRLVRD